MWHCLWLCLCSAYGIAYGIPCSFSGGRHPAGLFVLYHIGAVLVNRFRQNFGGICLFPAPGGAPVSGDCSGVAGALRGACLVCRLLTLPLVFDFAPYPPSPLPRRGRGRLKVYFAGGGAPGTPALNRLRHLQLLPYRYPAKGSLRLGAKTAEMLSFGQCRQPRRGGDRGRGPSAFEMVLSPGAGIASAAWGQAPQPPAGYHSGKVCRQPAGQVPRQRVIRAPAPVPPGFSPGDARGEAPCIRKQKISPFPPGRGSGGWGR